MTKPKEGAKKGRPSVYSDQLANHIAERLSKGEPLTAICSEEHMPTIRSIQLWMGQKPDFFALITRAREAGAEWLVGDMHERMMRLVNIEKGKALPEKVEIDAMRLYASHIQWMTSRWNPRRYSERVLAELAKQPEPMKDVTPEVDTTYMTYEERENMRQLLLAADRRKKAALIEYKEEQVDDGTDRAADRTED